MRLTLPVIALIFAASGSYAQSCGGNFSSFIKGMKSEAAAKGYGASTINNFFANVRHDPKVVRADRAQGVFQMTFVDFSRRLISQGRINKGRSNAKKYSRTFDRMEREFGVSRGVLLAFWAFETDYGAVQGNFNTLNALVTLSHDCRRPELFRPQVFSALELYARGEFSPTKTTGAWAGEIGMVQMLPADILENGIDGDGDGKVNMKTSAPDALLSGAQMLKHLGWRAGEPWLQQVTVPENLDWSKTGLNHKKSVAEWSRLGVKARSGNLGASRLQASIVLPQGRKGPAFIAYPNFHVYFEWNKSFVYVTTAAYFATRLEGAPVYDAGTPDTGLTGAQLKQLQRKLVGRGYDVGKVDGILGAKTRAAVQAEQGRLGLPADAWPTAALLKRL